MPYIYSNDYYQCVYSGDIFIATKGLLYIIASSQLSLCLQIPIFSAHVVSGGRGFRKASTVNETAVNK